MKQFSPINISIIAGIVAVLTGIIVFTLNWHLWEFWNGPLPGYQFFLFPGNLSLVYVWHPIFTEELNFWPKLILLLLGQFLLVFIASGLITVATNRFVKRK